MYYDTGVNRGKTVNSGYVALMATIIISIILLVMAVEEGQAGWHARFNILGTEAKEQANALAEGCADQALAAIVTDPSYAGNATTTTSGGTCHVFPIQFNTPTTGFVTIKTQAEVRSSFANLEIAMNMNQIHLGTPTPGKGTLIVVTQVVNDGSGTAAASAFTMHVAATNPSQALFSGSDSGVAVTVDPGAYTVTEDPLSGYATTVSTNCSGNISNGQFKFCTITNDDIMTTLSVIANVTNNDLGTNVPADFPLFIDGAPATLGTRYTVTSGSHTVSATTLSGYAVSPWGYDCAVGGTVTVNTGQSKTCIINFDDIPPPTPACAETVSIIDRTGSMSSSDMLNERAAVISLANLYSAVTPLPKMGVGSIGGLYGSTPAEVPDNTHPVVGWLTTTYSTITNAITQMTSSNSSVGSDLSAGITVANAELNSVRHVPGKQKVLILVSDGDPNQPSGSSNYDTGFLSATSSAQDAAGIFWNNPTGAYADGGTDATTTVSGSTSRERFFTFGFGGGSGLPSGATINGIQASVDAWNTSSALGAPATTTLTPSASGSFDQWTANTGTDVSAVASNDNDTSYIDTSVSINSFVVPGAAVPAGSAINSVTITAIAKSTVAGAIMQLVTEKGGAPNVGPNNTLTASYATYTRSMTTDPSTGNPWTLAEVNGWTTRFGVRTTNAAQTPRVTQFYVTVNYTPTGSTGFISPSANSSDSGGNGNGFETNPTGAYADGGSSALNSNNTGDRHRYFNYGISLPGGSTVTGIEVRPDWWLDSTSGTNSVDLELSWNGGGAWTAKKNDANETTSDTNNKIVGSTADTWGRAWSAASDFTNANFRVRITMNSSSNSRDFSLDWLPVNISYTLASVNTPALVPTASGTYHQWTANTGTDVTAVTSNDNDTSYIDNSVSLDTFAVPNAAVPAGSTINSVTISTVARSTTAGASLHLITEKSGAVSLDPSPKTLTTSYATYMRSMTTDPSTGSAWTLAEVNAWTTKFGVRTINGTQTPRVTQLSVLVSYTPPPPATACQLGVDLSWNAGSSWSNEKTQTLTSTETTYTLGSSSDDWTGSHTWAPSEFSNANFLARVRAIDPGASCDNSAIDHLDWLQLKVFYTQNVDPVVAALNAADAAKLAGTNLFTIHFGSDPAGYPGNELLANLASGPTPNTTYPGHQNGSFADPGGVTTGNTGFLSPNVQSADTGGDGNGFEVNPANAFADGPSGTSGAAQNIDGAGDRHRFSGYNLTVPPGGTITGIETRLDWWLDSTSGTNSMDVQLSWDGGTSWTSAKNDNNESTNTSNSRTLGSSADTWGHAWTADQLSNTNFRVRLTSNSTVSTRDFYLDWVPVRVSYSVNTENGDGDNFFLAPTSADMQGIFNFIGQQVCPALLNLAPPTPPTTGTILVITQVVNNNGGTKVPADFIANISATNPSQVSFPGSSTGVSVTVDPGAYSITENNVTGYNEILGATCSSATAGNIIAGETRVCVLTNDDIPPPPPPPNFNINTGSWQEIPG